MRLSLNKLLGLPPTARKWTFALGELVTEPPLSSVLGGGRNQPWGGASLAQGHPPPTGPSPPGEELLLGHPCAVRKSLQGDFGVKTRLKSSVLFV